MVKLFISLITIAFIFGYVNANSKNQNKNQETVFMSDIEKTPESTVAIIKTNMGTIEVELFEKETPKTVENFTGLAKKGYYNGIIFHRVIDKFMIQGGDPTGTGGGGESLWGGEFKDEIVSSLKFDKPGYLAMANAGPNTNGSQFFITTVATPWLNGKHTIFGKVIKGMDVVDVIGKVKTKTGDRPIKDVVMEKVTVEKRKK